MTIDLPNNSVQRDAQKFDFDRYDANRDGKLNDAEAKVAQDDGWNVKTGLHKSIWNEVEVKRKEDTNAKHLGTKSFWEQVRSNLAKVKSNDD